MELFSGTVLDGPWRGKNIEQRWPNFKVPLFPGGGYGATWLKGPCGANVDLKIVTYRWSRNLGQWCMEY